MSVVNIDYIVSSSILRFRPFSLEAPLHKYNGKYEERGIFDPGVCHQHLVKKINFLTWLCRFKQEFGVAIYFRGWLLFLVSPMASNQVCEKIL
jgi:hypothetical protein